MRTFSRIGLVSTIAFAAFVSPADGQQPEPPAIVSVSDGAAFAIKDAAGKYLALHFLAGTDAHCADFVRAYHAGRAGIAGVKHVFIYPGDAARARTWSTELTSALVTVDPGHSLATRLKIPVSEGHGHSATIVLDPAGKELFRHVGASHADHLSFDAFAIRMAQATRRPALEDYNLPKGKSLALEGYDPVAYFKTGKPAKGRPALASSYRGITYHFSTPEHRDLFAADPEKYLPTYGGWCASAMGANGNKVGVDPTNFKVKDGRLHLFYKGTFSNALDDWNRHEREWEPAADANWKKLTGEDPALGTR
jgi:YHS domain-containing protein